MMVRAEIVYKLNFLTTMIGIWTGPYDSSQNCISFPRIPAHDESHEQTAFYAPLGVSRLKLVFHFNILI